MHQNLGGALPGIGAMANYGAMRYTNAVVADDQGTYLTVTQTPVFQKHAAKIWSEDELDAFVKNPPLAAGFFTLPSSRMGERYHAPQRVQDCTFYVDWVILRIRHRQAD